METIKIILDLLHDTYESIINFLKFCKKVLQEIGPLLAEIFFLALPFAFLLWIVYEATQYLIPGSGIVFSGILALPIIVIFIIVVRKRKREKKLTQLQAIDDFSWSLKKVILVVMFYVCLIALGSVGHWFNSKENVAHSPVQDDSDKSENGRILESKDIQAKGISNENESIDTREGKNSVPLSNPPAIPPQLETPSALWSFITNSYFTHRENNRNKQISKVITWSLLLKNQEIEGNKLKLTLHEDKPNAASNSTIAIPLVTCRIPISSINTSIYKRLRSASVKERIVIKITGKITNLPNLEERSHFTKPTIEVDKNVEILELKDAEQSSG